MRKKFTMLFAALLAFVGVAKAQLVETSTDAAPKYYVIASYNRGGYLTNKGVGAGVEHVALEEGSYWYFEKANEEGGVYFVNKLKDGENKVYLGSDLKASTTAAVWYVKENGVNKKGLSISKTPTISNYSCIDANNSNTGVGTWQPSASDWEGTTWVFASITDPTYNPNNLIFRTRSDRYVTSVALNGGFNNSAEVNRDYQGNNGLVYNDLTETVTMRAVAGETVTASLERNGTWTNAYVYIDYDNDGFTAGIAEDGFTPAGDLVSYSFYSGDEADDTSGKNSAGTDLTTSARNTLTLPAFTAPSTPGTYRLRFKHDWNSINPNGGNTNFNSNGGSFIDVTLEVVSSTIDVVYTYKYNGVVKFTQTSKALVGDEFPALNQTLPYGVTATKPAGNIAESDVVDGKVAKDIEITNNLPFVAAADANNISTWYYVQMHSNNKKFIQYIDDDTAIEWADAQVDASAKDSYTWAFVGNPFDGFKFVNKAATTAKALKSENAGNPKMAPYADATSFVLAATSETSQGAAGGFCLKYPEGKCLNAQSGWINHWGSTDAGSTFTVVLRDDAAQIRELVENAKEVLAALGEGETVGYVTAASKTTLSNAIATAETAMETWEGIDAAEADLQEALANLETIQPEVGSYYRIVSACADGRAGQSIYVNEDGGMQFSAEDNAGKLFQFVDAGEGKFYLYNAEYGTYLNTAKAHNGGQENATATSTEGAVKVTISNLLKENIVGIYPEGGAMIHAQAANSVVVAWNNEANDNGSAWTIVEAEVADRAETFQHTLTVTEAGWATLVLGYNTTIPAGVNKAYAVSSIAEGKAVLAEVADVLPAHTPVLIEAAAGNYAFKYTADEATVESNLLAGSVFNTYVAPVEGTTNYVLSNNGGVVALYKKTTTNNAGKIVFAANKAYLPVETATEGAPAMFSFGRGEGTTGIETAVSGEQTVVIYDLAGRRVEKMEKGIYIVNGKKVIR